MIDVLSQSTNKHYKTIKKIDDLTDKQIVPRNSTMVNNTPNMLNQLIDIKNSSITHQSPLIQNMFGLKDDEKNKRNQFNNHRTRNLSFNHLSGSGGDSEPNEYSLPSRSIDNVQKSSMRQYSPSVIQPLIKPLNKVHSMIRPVVHTMGHTMNHTIDQPMVHSMGKPMVHTMVQPMVHTMVRSIESNPFIGYQSNVSNMQEPTSVEYVITHLKTIREKRPHMDQRLYQRLFGDNSSENCINNDGLTEGSSLTIPPMVDESVKIDYSRFFARHIKHVQCEKIIKLMDISKSPQKLKNRYVSEQNNIVDYFDQKEDILNNYDVTRRENINKITSMYGRDFLVEVLGTYRTEESILKQFLADFPRQDIFLNGSQILSIDELFVKLGPFNKMINLNTIIGADINQYMERYEKTSIGAILLESNNLGDDLDKTAHSRMVFKANKDATISLIMLSIVFICQSSFYQSFAHLHNKITRMKNVLNTPLVPRDSNPCEIDLNSHEIDPKNNIYLSDHSERCRADFTITKDHFKCALSAAYKIIDVTDENILFKVNSETLFDIDNDLCLITYHTE